jgi:hypothetical protein
VLLNEIAIAIYNDVVISNPSIWQAMIPMIVVNSTCHIPVSIETLPTSFKMFGFKFSHTINNSIAIPISEKIFISVPPPIIPDKLNITQVII